MELITSVSNPKIKQWQKLQTKKGRHEQQAFLIEGMHLLEEALLAQRTPRAVIVRDGTDLPDEWLTMLRQKKVPCYVVPPPVFRRLSTTQHPQGVAAVMPMVPPPQPLETLLEKRELTGLLVDGVQDPGNLGAMVRTAEAFGADFLLLGEGTVDLYNDKVVRASMGSLFRVPVYQGPLEDWLEPMKRSGVTVVAAEVQAPERLDRYTFPPKVAFLVGNEARGVSSRLSEAADVRLVIPMTGAAESLNVSVATAVLLYERIRQNMC